MPPNASSVFYQFTIGCANQKIFGDFKNVVLTKMMRALSLRKSKVTSLSLSLSFFLFVYFFLSLFWLLFFNSLSLFGFHLSILSFPLLQSFYLCFYSVFCLFHSLFLSLCHAVSVSVSLFSLFFLLYLRSICLLRKLFCL